MKTQNKILETLSDEELAVLSRESVDAETVLLVRYFRLVRFHAGRCASVLTDADDLIQEGCVALLRAMKQFDLSRDVKFSAFAQTCIINSMKSLLRREQAVAVPAGDLLQDHQFVDENTPESILIRKESYKNCRMQVMAMLSEKEWEILQIVLEGCSYAQTAERLHITLKSVDNAMQRIRRKMRTIKHFQK